MDLPLSITTTLIVAGALASAILILWITRQPKAGEKHLEELKRLCLEPLLKGGGVIVLGEPSSVHDIKRFFKTPGAEDLDPAWIQCPSQLDWCRSFSLTRLCPEHLYRDLDNHWPELYRKLEEIEELVRETYPRFAELRCRVLEKIRTLLNSKIEAELQSPAQNRLGERDIGTKYREAVENEAVITLAVLLTMLGERVERWSEVSDARREWYRKLSIFLRDIESIAEQVSRENRGDVEELKRIEAHAQQAVEEAVDLLARAMSSRRLKGKCRHRG